MSAISRFNDAIRTLWGKSLPDCISPLVRGTGLLQGHTNPGSDAGPAIISQGVSDNDAQHFIPGETIRITADAYDQLFEFTNGSPPVNGDAVDVSITGIGSDLAAQYTVLIAAIAGTGFAGTAVYNTGNHSWDVATTATGASVTLFHEYTIGESSVHPPLSPGIFTASGTDAVAPSGAITEVTIIPQDGINTIKPVYLCSLMSGVAVDVQLALKVGDSYHQIGTCGSGSGAIVVNPGSAYAEWVNGRASAALVARMMDAAPVGGSQRFLAIVEQTNT